MQQTCETEKVKKTAAGVIMKQKLQFRRVSRVWAPSG